MIVVYCSHTDTFASNFRCVNKHGSGAWRSLEIAGAVVILTRHQTTMMSNNQILGEHV